MFQFPGFPACVYFIQHTLPGSSPGGLPHSDIHGSVLIYSSPWLFAVSHVLLRLPVPRHSPYALFRLNFLTVLAFFAIACVRFVSVLKVILISPFAKLLFTLYGKTNFLLVSLFCYVSRFFSLFGFQRSFPQSAFRLPKGVSIDLFSLAVSRLVSSALNSLTSVFGMGTGGPCSSDTDYIPRSVKPGYWR